MKTMRYRFLDIPVSFDDCLDQAEVAQDVRVDVGADSHVQIGDTDIITQWIATYTWQFPERTVTCREVCGATRLSDGRKGMELAHRRANHKLQARFRRLRSAGVEINGADSRFAAPAGPECAHAESPLPDVARIPKAPRRNDSPRALPERMAVAGKSDRGIRDYLAEDRTILASERTFLAYVRTALTFLAAGLTFIKFFDSPAFIVIGWCLIPIAPIVLAVGIRNYLKMRHLIKIPD
jgi:putative membrane protein